MKSIRDEYQERGFIIHKDEVFKDLVNEVRIRFQSIYQSRFGSVAQINRNIIKRFGDDFAVQSLFSNYIMVNLVGKLGIDLPVFCGPVVTHYTSTNSTGQSFGLPLHQDWPSMGSSINSLIIWFNLQYSGSMSHSVAVAPGMHTKMLLPGTQGDRGYVLKDPEKYNLEVLELNAGEVLIMSSFLPHMTYVNKNYEGWKLSLSRRVDDFGDHRWVKREYRNAYNNTVDRDVYLL
jgi:hypothetical protein